MDDLSNALNAIKLVSAELVSENFEKKLNSNDCNDELKTEMKLELSLGKKIAKSNENLALKISISINRNINTNKNESSFKSVFIGIYEEKSPYIINELLDLDDKSNEFKIIVNKLIALLYPQVKEHIINIFNLAKMKINMPDTIEWNIEE